jgi:hypothetical protein
MTAAIAHLMRPSLPAPSGVWPARVLTVLALVLPIPFCSALGLSLPLPATVARIAAKLVPFANSAVLDAREEQLLGARGSIVGSPGERASNGVTSFAASGSATLLGPHPHDSGGRDIPAGNVDGSMTATPNATANTPAAEEHGSPAPRQTDPIASPTLPGGSTSTPDTGSTTPQGGTDPVPPSDPPTVVDTTTAAAATVVGTVSNTATTAVTTVPAAAATAVGVVTGAVSPVLPPKP